MFRKNDHSHTRKNLRFISTLGLAILLAACNLPHGTPVISHYHDGADQHKYGGGQHTHTDLPGAPAFQSDPHRNDKWGQQFRGPTNILFATGTTAAAGKRDHPARAGPNLYDQRRQFPADDPDPEFDQWGCLFWRSMTRPEM